MLKQHLSKILTIVFVAGMSLGVVTNSTGQQNDELDRRIMQARFKQEQRLQTELTCLARNIYFESASEPYRGKVAVAQVTMNRVRSGKFPASVCGVVHQKTRFDAKTVCQFSWVCEGNLRIRAPHLYTESMRVARQVLIEGVRLPELKHAMFFHAKYIQPNWKRTPVASIGGHIFY